MEKIDCEDRQKRAILSKRILAICPKCNSRIHADYVMSNNKFTGKYQSAKTFPFKHVITCPHNPKEKLSLFFDANLQVRDLEMNSDCHQRTSIMNLVDCTWQMLQLLDSIGYQNKMDQSKTSREVLQEELPRKDIKGIGLSHTFSAQTRKPTTTTLNT